MMESGSFDENSILSGNSNQNTTQNNTQQKGQEEEILNEEQKEEQKEKEKEQKEKEKEEADKKADEIIKDVKEFFTGPEIADEDKKTTYTERDTQLSDLDDDLLDEIPTIIEEKQETITKTESQETNSNNEGDNNTTNNNDNSSGGENDNQNENQQQNNNNISVNVGLSPEQAQKLAYYKMLCDEEERRLMNEKQNDPEYLQLKEEREEANKRSGWLLLGSTTAIGLAAAFGGPLLIVLSVVLGFNWLLSLCENMGKEIEINNKYSARLEDFKRRLAFNLGIHNFNQQVLGYKDDVF